MQLYRWTLSPAKTFLFGPLGGCRFTPSCSAYAARRRPHPRCAGRKLARVKRVCRCHPWGGCGHDPVPQTKSEGLRLKSNVEVWSPPSPARKFSWIANHSSLSRLRRLDVSVVNRAGTETVSAQAIAARGHQHGCHGRHRHGHERDAHNRPGPADDRSGPGDPARISHQRRRATRRHHQRQRPLHVHVARRRIEGGGTGACIRKRFRAGVTSNRSQTILPR